jgi:predicted enzyme related to lactoylglutathione lyase
MLGGRAVAGIGSVPPGAQMPSVWTTYIAVDDLDATATRVTEHGGTIMMGPMDVMDQGRFAVAADPTGAVFGMWQAQQHIGAQRVNEAGSPIWNECTTRDYEAAKRFYAGVFGYDLQEVGDGQSFHYSLLNLGGNTVGGLGAPAADTPADAPPSWLSYFAVDDTDATVAAAVTGGASIQVPPHDSEYGRLAVLGGPQGEVFAVIKPSEQSGAADS